MKANQRPYFKHSNAIFHRGGAQGQVVYQHKAQLAESAPPIWRRILSPGAAGDQGVNGPARSDLLQYRSRQCKTQTAGEIMREAPLALVPFRSHLCLARMDVLF